MKWKFPRNFGKFFKSLFKVVNVQIFRNFKNFLDWGEQRKQFICSIAGAIVFDRVNVVRDVETAAEVHLALICRTLMFVGCTINPFIYAFVGRHFRMHLRTNLAKLSTSNARYRSPEGLLAVENSKLTHKSVQMKYSATKSADMRFCRQPVQVMCSQYWYSALFPFLRQSTDLKGFEALLTFAHLTPNGIEHRLLSSCDYP